MIIFVIFLHQIYLKKWKKNAEKKRAGPNCHQRELGPIYTSQSWKKGKIKIKPNLALTCQWCDVPPPSFSSLFLFSLVAQTLNSDTPLSPSSLTSSPWVSIAPSSPTASTIMNLHHLHPLSSPITAMPNANTATIFTVHFKAKIKGQDRRGGV